MKPKLLLVLFSLVFIAKINGQLSQKHYIPPLTFADEGNANPEEQFIYISTPSNQDISYTITPVGSNNDIVGVVSKNSPQVFTVGSGTGQLFVPPTQTSSVHNDKGYIIEATGGQIYVSVRVRAGSSAQAGALVSKGAAALGTVFRAGMFTNENPQSNYLNFISVMATEDETKVNFSGLPEGIIIENFSGSQNIPEITLNEGESYIVATNANDDVINRDGLIGTLIQSDKNIVVNVGSANGSFGSGGARDYGLDQIVDFSKVGTEYIFVRGSGSNEWENVLIVAHEDNTTVSVGGNALAVINSGDYFVIEGNSYSSDGNMYVQTSKPAFAYQGVGGLANNGNPSEANQGMFFVPPLSCESRGNVDNIAGIDRIGGTTFNGGITIVTNRDANILINGASINNFNPDGPNDVVGNSDYVTYKVTGLTNNVSVESSEELYCAYFNQNGAATSGSFYSGFLVAPEINFNTTVAALGSCIPNVVLEAAGADLFDSFKWEFFNENTATWEERSTETAYKPLDTEPGRYRLVGKIDCSPDEDFISSEIPVSICPDDFDEDLIIDNIDVDIDNDGILNCEESFGNVTINLSNNSNAVAIHPENASNLINATTFTTPEATNSFSGDASGNFTSTIVNVPLTESSYTLSFNQSINIAFTQSNTESHLITEGEYFIIKVNPSSKNITLLDPDDQLLINNSFDLNQEFESGITQKSASEIWFKYKDNVNAGNSTFTFVANKVDEITFEHKSTGINANSTFNGNITLTCFGRDSDGDGIEDAFDNDSDNDGIPDFFESIALDNISLSDTDTNQDGLNDIFDTVTPNKDSDNDGVPNYLDVDSDNDGIYDLIEAGLSASLDTNSDGIIDNAISSSGTNGLYNPIETSTDSGILNFSINNSDSNAEVEANRDDLFDFVDLDSDGDDCFDVTEAGFTGNGSGVLAPNPLDVNTKGKVLNTDGYTTPNNDYFVSAPIIVTEFEDAFICENDTDTITIETNANNEIQFAWEASVDGTVWNTLNNDATYSGTLTNNLQITNTSSVFNGNQYRVVLTRTGNSCPKTSDPITLTVNPLPTPNPVAQINECASDRNTATVNLSRAEINIINNPENYNFEYFATQTDAINGNNQLTAQEYQTYELAVNVTRSAWVRTIDKTTNCFEVSEIQATASFTPNVAFNETISLCDDIVYLDENGDEINSDKDETTSFDFTNAEESILDEIVTSTPTLVKDDIEVLFFETESDRDASINRIANITNYRNSVANSQVIYIKVNNKNNNECQGIGDFLIEVNPLPDFSVEGEAPEEPQLLCLNDISLNLEVENPLANDYSYSWQDENGNDLGIGNNIDVFSKGNYTVTATINATGCSRSRTITVEESDLVTLDNSFVTINDNLINSQTNNLSVFIDVTKIGLVIEDFLYAIATEDGTIIQDYQDSPLFENLQGGIYKVLIENKDGCGNSESLISVIEIPKYFSPNNDGKNDFWNVKGVDQTFYSTADIKIFDRFGKLINITTVNDLGWDGTFNGASLPEDDYWYTINLIPTDTSKKAFQKTGHFSLIKKN